MNIATQVSILDQRLTCMEIGYQQDYPQIQIQ